MHAIDRGMFEQENGKGQTRAQSICLQLWSLESRAHISYIERQRMEDSLRVSLRPTTGVSSVSIKRTLADRLFYPVDDVTNYLVDSYQDTPIIVSIYEDEEPYHLIAISTGTVSSRIVAIDDETRECAPGLEDDPNECTAIRVPVSTLDSSSYDKVIAEAHELHKSGGFPSTQLTVKCSEEIGTALYVSQSAVFEIPNENLRWRVIIASPATTSTEDAIQPSSPLFGSILFISGLGFITCLAFLAWLYLNRSKRAVITSDWRFTGLFIVGAALLNLTNLLLLGENTKASCMSRMWGFHLAFAVMISPLFVKIWRIKVLVGGDVRRRTITNQQAAMYTLSLIVLQIVILTILSVVDPLAPVEFTEVSEGVFTHHIVCDHSSRAGQFTELVFETTIIFIGCVLAYQCRDMDKEFGESKQLLFTISCDMGIGYGREWTQFTTSYWSSLDDSVLYFLVCSS